MVVPRLRTMGSFAPPAPLPYQKRNKMHNESLFRRRSPEPSSLLPPHSIPLGRPSAPAPSIQYRASNLDWQLVSYMIFYEGNPVGEGTTRRGTATPGKTTWFPPLGKMRPLPATASHGKSQVLSPQAARGAQAAHARGRRAGGEV